MGLVHAEIELVNSGDMFMFNKGLITADKVHRIKVIALVDTGAYTLAINESIKNQLDLPVIGEGPATLANGDEILLEIVGPVEVRFENRTANVDAIVLPGENEILFGAIPMEAMDVLVDPRNQRLIVNPKHPYKAGFVLK